MSIHRGREDGSLLGDIELEEVELKPLLGEHVAPPPAATHPFVKASHSFDGKGFASKLFFFWINPVLDKGSMVETLKLEDTLELPAELTASMLSADFDNSWQQRVEVGQPSLLWSLHTMFARYGMPLVPTGYPRLPAHRLPRDFWVAGIFRFVTEACNITSPMIIRELILHIKGESTLVPSSTVGGIFLAFILFAVVLLQASSLQQFIHGVFMVGACVNTTATAAVYNKALRLSKQSLEGSRLGETINFQAKDASKLREVIVFFHNLWAAPLTAVGCTVLLIYVLGPSALVGVCSIPVLIPLETWVAQRSQKYRKSVLKVSDARISLIGEIIDGIKTIKLTSLGDLFGTRVQELRFRELGSIRKALTLNAYNQAVMRSSPILVALVTFSAYILMGNVLTAETAFTALALFNTVSHPFHVMPKAIQLLADAKVAIKRLEGYLLVGETRSNILQPHQFSGNEMSPDPRIVLKNAKFSPVTGIDCLDQVSADIQGGLTLLVGPVGSGKSTLLQGIVQHQGVEDNEVKVETQDGRVALCPDMPWIVNATARENICIGSTRNFNAEHYQRCVHACALEADFAEWPVGDETVIGAKGITISGGQKARIALARALYSGCKVALLDDPLSAVDNIVGRWVFDHAVQEMAAKGVVVMATHQNQYLKDADNMLVVTNGTVEAHGDFGYLKGKGVDMSAMVGASEQASALSLEGEKSKQGAPHVSGSGETPLDTAGKVHKKVQQRFADRIDADRSKGGVSWSVYTTYAQACGALAVMVTLLVSIFAQIASVSKEYILALWSDRSSKAPPMTYLAVYSAVCVTVVMINCLRFYVICWLGLQGSTKLHQSLLSKVLGAPLQFFQVTEIGRITARFASDFDAIDLVIPTTLSSFVDALLTTVAAVAVVAGTTPAFLFFITPIVITYHRVQRRYRSAAKELKRLDSATKSPIYSHFQETLDGLASVQAYGVQSKMRERSFFLIDANMRSRLCWDATNRWLGIRLDFLGASAVFLAALLTVLAGHTSPGIVGLGLSYALTVTRTLSFGIRSSTAMENQFNAVERVQEFICLEQEHSVLGGEEERVPDTWPSGTIVINDVHARYRADLPPVLKGVSLSIRNGERVGVCGRTGCGKSTLALALVRALDCFQGTITMDGYDISRVPLSLLRSRVAIISQDAQLFSGTVRSAIDPRGQWTDAQIWNIVDSVGIKSFLGKLPLGLESPVSERGGNWSAGERQLLCIARAMVNQPRVLIFDEATANVDIQTDSIIQDVIQSHLSHAVVIVIAHRLEDVLTCDQVVVMDAGSIVEKGEPSSLLENPEGKLSQLVQELGPDLGQNMRTIMQSR